MTPIKILLYIFCYCISAAAAFMTSTVRNRHTSTLYATSPELREEAARLREQATLLRKDLPQVTNFTPPKIVSQWDINEDNDTVGVDYTLQISIGREEGTWMDPRWAASGARIDLTLNVRFTNDNSVVSTDLANKMVNDNILSNKNNNVFSVVTAPYAKLRNGFDKLACTNGAYRIDNGKTLRFFIETAGIESGYGDVTIPAGCLYFSLPIFNGSLSQLSSKEGPVTVRQVGWHTGWRRQESRIVGVFTAKKKK